MIRMFVRMSIIIIFIIYTGTRHVIIRKAHRYKLTSGIEPPSSIRPRERLLRENVPRGPNVGARDLGSDLIPIHLPVHHHHTETQDPTLFVLTVQFIFIFTSTVISRCFMSLAAISFFCFLRRAVKGATGYRGGLTSACACGSGHTNQLFVLCLIHQRRIKMGWMCAG